MPEGKDKAACPECGNPLEGLDRKKHAATHWGGKQPDGGKSPDAAKRHAALVGGE